MKTPLSGLARAFSMALLALLAIDSALLAAEEGSPPARQLGAAATRWKMEGPAARLTTRGPVGQHDLFWEIVRLWERDEPARSDEDLVAVMTYLLESAGLAKDPALSAAAGRLVPALSPGLGSRQMEGLVGAWARELTGAQMPAPFWSQDGFPGLPKEPLAVAARRLLRGPPEFQGPARVWMAALLAMVDARQGTDDLQRELAAAAGRSEADERDLVMAVGRSRDPSCLRVLLFLAGRELAADRKPLPDGSQGLAEFHRLTDAGSWRWSDVRYGVRVPEKERLRMDPREEVANAKMWLAECEGRLTWHNATGKFAGALPPVYGAVERARRLYGLKIDPDILARQQGYRDLTSALVTLMEKEPAAARDPELGKNLLTLAEKTYMECRNEIYIRLPRVNREMGVEAWRKHMHVFLAPSKESRGYFLQSMLSWTYGRDPEIVAEARAMLLPEMKDLYEKAIDAPAPERLERALALLFAGGDIPEGTFNDLVKKGRGTVQNQRVRLGDWGRALAMVGKREGLWAMLAELEENPDGRLLQSLEYISGQQSARHLDSPREKNEELVQRVGRARKWLETYEKDLEFTARVGIFQHPTPMIFQEGKAEPERVVRPAATEAADPYALPGGGVGPEDVTALARLMKLPADARPDTNVMVLVDKVLANQPGVSEYGILLDLMDRMGAADRKVKIYEDMFRRYPAERKANEEGYRTALKKSGQSDAASREWMKIAARQLGGARVSSVAVTAESVWAATDRGAYCCNRRTREWMKFAVNDVYLDKPVQSVKPGDTGRVIFEMELDGKNVTFLYDPATLQWSGKP